MKQTANDPMPAAQIIAVRLIFLLFVGVMAGCASSKYYAQDRDQDRKDYVNRLECPGTTIPVCTERGGEIVDCQCIDDSNLGKVIL